MRGWLMAGALALMASGADALSLTADYQGLSTSMTSPDSTRPSYEIALKAGLWIDLPQFSTLDPLLNSNDQLVVSLYESGSRTRSLDVGGYSANEDLFEFSVTKRPVSGARWSLRLVFDDKLSLVDASFSGDDNLVYFGHRLGGIDRVLSEGFGYSAPAQDWTITSTVPLPAGGALLLAALPALALRKRQRTGTSALESITER